MIAVRGWDDSRVPWTKPDAPTPDDLKELPAAVIRADGSVREVQRTEDLSVLRATIRRSALTAALPVAPAPRAVVVRPIPPELDLIPRDAAGFLTVPVQEVMTAPALAWARKRLFPDGEYARMVGLVTQLDLKDITRATVIWPTADHIGWNVMAVPGEIPSRLVVLTTAAAIDKSNPWLRAGKGTEEYRGRRYLLDADGWTAIFLADDRTLVFGSHASVRLVIDRLADPKPGPLDGAVRNAADGPKRVVLGAQGPKVRRVLADNLPPQFQLAAPAYTADRVTVAIDLRDDLTIDVLGAFVSEAAAADGHAALVKAFAAGAEELDLQVGKLPAEDATDPERLEDQKLTRDFVTQTRDAFRVAKPERHGTQLRLTFVSKSGFLGCLVLPGFGYVLMPTGLTHFDPAVAGKNDATVAKALLAYHAKHGRFPLPAILSKEGKPLLSWRVALLPHLGDEAAALYKKFNLEEAWDSPANKKLLDLMPAELCTDPLQTAYRPRPHTGYRVYTAKGSVFEGPGGLSKKDITDDPAATILAVRFMERVPWTKPDKLTFDNLEAIPEAAIFVNGTVQRLAGNEDPNTLKAMITRAGGENVKPKSDPIRPVP